MKKQYCFYRKYIISSRLYSYNNGDVRYHNDVFMNEHQHKQNMFF